eukprot:TRINITY_DN17472_c1_g1_i1.p1 TRINITY_DN17472_c1_g1~~TRINITY_DN17472_c1_g1_i1.p1  ORF type:complete len:831 (+),score=149.76 TRINITY_DN17472_c1_g1_i1:107-2494(+)
MSYLGSLANCRLEEATRVFGNCADEGPRKAGQQNGPGGPDAGGAASGHPASSSKVILPIQAVKPDATVSDTMKAGALKHFKVFLPMRLTMVTVTVTLEENPRERERQEEEALKQGKRPPPPPKPLAVWGSVTNKRPDSRDYDFRGIDGKLVYEHALPEQDGDADGDTEDPPHMLSLSAASRRKRGIPESRDFYFTVDSANSRMNQADSAFKLLVTFAALKLKAEDIVVPVRGKHRWEAKIAAITRGPAEREEFDNRIVSVLAKRQEMRDLQSGGVDFRNKNLKLTMEASPTNKKLHLAKTALRGLHRQDQAFAKRQGLEDVYLQERQEWLFRQETKRKEREAKEMQIALEKQRENVQQSWFSRLALMTFAIRSARKFKERKEMISMMQRERGAVAVLSRFLRKMVVMRRRRLLYHNVIKFQAACVVFTRTNTVVARSLAAPAIRSFLSEFAFHRDNPTLAGTLKRFRAVVVSIQRTYFTMKMVRRTYVKILLPYWFEVQQECYKVYSDGQAESKMKEMLAKQATDDQLQGLSDGGGRPSPSAAQASFRKRPSVANLGSPSSSRSSDNIGRRTSVAPRGSVVPGSLRRPTLFQRCKTSLNIKQMPQYISELVLTDHVHSMQKSHQKRLEGWGEEMQKAKAHLELQTFAGSQGEEAKAAMAEVQRLLDCKPKKVYVDKEAMSKLCWKAIDDWHTGKYRYVTNNRRRILRKFFKAFAGDRTTTSAIRTSRVSIKEGHPDSDSDNGSFSPTSRANANPLSISELPELPEDPAMNRGVSEVTEISVGSSPRNADDSQKAD